MRFLKKIHALRPSRFFLNSRFNKMYEIKKKNTLFIDWSGLWKFLPEIHILGLEDGYEKFFKNHVLRPVSKNSLKIHVLRPEGGFKNFLKMHVLRPEGRYEKILKIIHFLRPEGFEKFLKQSTF